MKKKVKQLPASPAVVTKSAPGRRATLQEQLAPMLFGNAKEGMTITDELILQSVQGLINLVNMPLDIVVATHDKRTGRFHVANIMPESQMTPDMMRSLMHGAIDLVTREETLRAAQAAAEKQAAEAQAAEAQAAEAQAQAVPVAEVAAEPAEPLSIDARMAKTSREALAQLKAGLK